MHNVSSVLSCVGNTPIVKLFSNDLSPELKDKNVYAKIESRNPGFSVKDRIARAMIEDAINNNQIGPDTTIIEPTSGNTGIGLAVVCAALGLKLKLVMPETMSVERRNIIKLLGAEIILTPGDRGMNGAIETAGLLQKEIANSYMPQQFENPSNPEIHRRTTAVEYLSFMKMHDIKPDVMVFGVGTGGTLTGVAEVVKKSFPDVLIYAVEPYDSPVLSGGKPGPHKIQGIGAGFVPKNLNIKITNGIIRVKNDEAFSMAARLAKLEGILAGVSSGAAAFAAMQIAMSRPAGTNIFTLLPDSAERYLSMLV